MTIKTNNQEKQSVTFQCLAPVLFQQQPFEIQYIYFKHRDGDESVVSSPDFVIMPAKFLEEAIMSIKEVGGTDITVVYPDGKKEER